MRDDVLTSGDFYPGDLLNAVLGIESRHWTEYPAHRDGLRIMLDQHFELPPELHDAVRAFRAR